MRRAKSIVSSEEGLAHDVAAFNDFRCHRALANTFPDDDLHVVRRWAKSLAVVTAGARAQLAKHVTQPDVDSASSRNSEISHNEDQTVHPLVVMSTTESETCPGSRRLTR